MLQSALLARLSNARGLVTSGTLRTGPCLSASHLGTMAVIPLRTAGDDMAHTWKFRKAQQFEAALGVHLGSCPLDPTMSQSMRLSSHNGLINAAVPATARQTTLHSPNNQHANTVTSAKHQPDVSVSSITASNNFLLTDMLRRLVTWSFL